MFDGRWDLVMKTPMGEQHGELRLATTNGSLAGEMDSALMGAMPIEAGTIDGDTARWQVQVTSPMKVTIKCEAKVDGDSMTGTAKAGMLMTSAFTGSRIAE